MAKQTNAPQVDVKSALMEGFEDPVSWDVQTVIYIGTAAKTRRTFAACRTASFRRFFLCRPLRVVSWYDIRFQTS
jgi:hypothetical protein